MYRQETEIYSETIQIRFAKISVVFEPSHFYSSINNESHCTGRRQLC